MPIVNSHYVPLQEPYPIIYYGGSVAMQIGTLIIVNGPGEERGMPGRVVSSRMYTCSYPVVAYGNKHFSEPRNEWRLNMWSEGVVWDYVQLKDVYTFCFTKQREINFEAVDVLTTSIRIKEAVSGTYKFRLSVVLNEIEKMGISKPALLTRMEPAGPAKVFVNRDLAKDIVCVRGFGALFCCVRLSENIEDMAVEIRRQVADYLMLLKPKEFELSYEADNEECKELVNALNEKQ